MRTCCWRPTRSASRAATTTSRRFISPMRSRRLRCGATLRSPPTAHRRILIEPAEFKQGLKREGKPVKLNMMKPSVNNMAARVFLRAANLEFTEDDVYGKTRTPEFLAKNPAHLTPMLEAKELPKGAIWESCAIMQYLSNKHDITKFYP